MFLKHYKSGKSATRRDEETGHASWAKLSLPPGFSVDITSSSFPLVAGICASGPNRPFATGNDTCGRHNGLTTISLVKAANRSCPCSLRRNVWLAHEVSVGKTAWGENGLQKMQQVPREHCRKRRLWSRYLLHCKNIMLQRGNLALGCEFTVRSAPFGG
jgi:hypothetical protein